MRPFTLLGSPVRFGLPLTVALLGCSFVSVGCRVEEEPTVVVPAESHDGDERALESVANEEQTTPAETTDTKPPVDEAAESPAIVEPQTPPTSAAPAGVDLQGPDAAFQRPTLPNATLQAQEEPAEPPVEITDRSAEAETPAVLPGDVPIDDLFEGLDATPKTDR